MAITGSGFAAAAPYDLSIVGVDFGQSLTDAKGDFSAGVIPGGIGARHGHAAPGRHQLTARDG